ncbi:type II toxin-antitoxin system VapC family toxin [Treponema sp.]|uniref:type II toxin-antitoxin system VapC family toxin n=1 Tax=Treponema sp. TaxID=166 RepID=UPI00388EDA66
MKKIYLLDTNIVSEFSKERPNEKVLDYYNVRKDYCAISSVTWQELVFSVSRMPDGKRKNTVMGFIENLRNNIEIIPYDEFAASICGEVQSNAEQAGKKLPYNDSQIAATAISNGMVLVTHNTEDFSYMAEKTFLKMEDWFAA